MADGGDRFILSQLSCRALTFDPGCQMDAKPACTYCVVSEDGAFGGGCRHCCHHGMRPCACCLQTCHSTHSPPPSPTPLTQGMLATAAMRK
ncbi:hypothetical protein AAFF_G00079040 [Aldrovandia affinis]|uniref:Uncharacterized protein n=1 Tax=Aldrovandia affinis TaxID=143900 RepID=A0AAD7WCW7_9TELE|nr:hypothetical protein AAFF_G00079040 [Aldrovandia affinis]